MQNKKVTWYIWTEKPGFDCCWLVVFDICPAKQSSYVMIFEEYDWNFVIPSFTNTMNTVSLFQLAEMKVILGLLLCSWFIYGHCYLWSMKFNLYSPPFLFSLSQTEFNHVFSWGYSKHLLVRFHFYFCNLSWKSVPEKSHRNQRVSLS